MRKLGLGSINVEEMFTTQFASSTLFDELYLSKRSVTKCSLVGLYILYPNYQIQICWLAGWLVGRWVGGWVCELVGIRRVCCSLSCLIHCLWVWSRFFYLINVFIIRLSKAWNWMIICLVSTIENNIAQLIRWGEGGLIRNFMTFYIPIFKIIRMICFTSYDIE